MKVEELVPIPDIKALFKLSAYKAVPNSSGCYVLTTYDDYILYIGLTDNLLMRFQQHIDNPVKTKPNVEGKAIWFYYKLYNSKKLNFLERTWINQFVAVHGNLPILNKVNSPII